MVGFAGADSSRELVVDDALIDGMEEGLRRVCDTIAHRPGVDLGWVDVSRMKAEEVFLCLRLAIR